MAASEDDLRAALEQRFKGDRSGACIAAAVIGNGTTTQAYFCANTRSERAIDERTAFEIGSITKTMTAALLAEIIGRGEIAIDDPLAKLLPAGQSRTDSANDVRATPNDSRMALAAVMLDPMAAKARTAASRLDLRNMAISCGSCG